MSEIITYANYYMKQDLAFVVKLQKLKRCVQELIEGCMKRKLGNVIELDCYQILILTKEGENT